MFEIYYLPLHLELGEEQPDMPGMIVRLPPRRAQRGRMQDVLIALLTPFSGGHPGARVLDSMLEEASSIYFNSRGSTTSGMRSAAEHLNHLFLKYNANLQGNRKDGQIFGYLNLAVLHGEALYLVHVGATFSYLLQPDQFQSFEADSARGRGLGLSRTAPISYFQAPVTPDSLLLFCADPAQPWADDALARGPRLTINLLRRRIASASGGELQAAIVQFKPSDRMAAHRLRPRAPLSSAALTEPESELPPVSQTDEILPEVESPALPTDGLIEEQSAAEVVQAPIPAESSEKDEPASPPEQMSMGEEQTLPTEDLASPAEEQASQIEEHAPPTEEQAPPLERQMTPQEAAASPIEAPDETPREEQPRAARRPRPATERQSRPPAKKTVEARQPDPLTELKKAARRQERRKKLAALWQDWHSRQKNFGSSIKSMFARLLPGISEESPQMSGGSMLFISIVIPLLVVVVAATIYLRSGRGQKHQLYLEQAQLFAADARRDDEPAAERNNWNQALYWLDLAEEYQQSDESQLLREQASDALDELDGIERLGFKPLTAYSFSNTLNFTQVTANDTEVYLLDSSQGRVLRLFLTGQGYELDNEFSCSPGMSGTHLVGDLVDMITLPPGSFKNASVLAVDASGNLLYCIAGAEAPISGQLSAPLDDWGEIGAITYYQGYLYVLDTLYGALYSYSGYNMEFGGEPEEYFDLELDETIPDLHEMIDLAVYGEDLYLLNENGTIARCTSGIFEGSQTRCDNPASFGDMRPGMEEQTLVFPNAFFAQVQTSSPPDPSLFLLDVNSPAVYRFSLQLNLDRLIQPSQYTDYDLPEPPATAFSISPSWVIFIAYGNDVIYASLSD